jgi:hypothetical protein
MSRLNLKKALFPFRERELGLIVEISFWCDVNTDSYH